MLHAAGMVSLNSKVDWLLGADAQMPLGTCLQSRAEMLPLAQQHMLVLLAVCHCGVQRGLPLAMTAPLLATV